MTEGPQKVFLTCPECNERVLVDIPRIPAARTEQTTSCSEGHTVAYNEQALGEPDPPTDDDCPGLLRRIGRGNSARLKPSATTTNGIVRCRRSTA
jgi:hypothetical protein